MPAEQEITVTEVQEMIQSVSDRPDPLLEMVLSDIQRAVGGGRAVETDKMTAGTSSLASAEAKPGGRQGGSDSPVCIFFRYIRHSFTINHAFIQRGISHGKRPKKVEDFLGLTGKIGRLYATPVLETQKNFLGHMQKVALGQKSAEGTIPENPRQAWISYGTDFTRRSVLFWDVMRESGNNYIEHVREDKPPHPAFEWEMISDVYTRTAGIKANGQVIVRLVQEDVGPLGIFISGKVARKERREIIEAPGISGMPGTVTR